MTIWYHLKCAAYRRPEPFLEALLAVDQGLDDQYMLRSAAEFSLAHRRVCRIGGVERSSSGRARCRACRELIARDILRIPLLFYEEGLFAASGFVHVTCAAGYFESDDLFDCICHFSPDIGAAERREIEQALHGSD